MDQIIPISEVRSQLPALVNQVSDLSQRILITVKGKVKAALVSPDEIESMDTTTEILNDPIAMRNIRQGLKEIKAGKTIPWEQIKAELNL